MAWSAVAPTVETLAGLAVVLYLVFLAARSRREVGHARCACGGAYDAALDFCPRCGVGKARS
ncbi:MAG TPA: hypothetical protein VI997_02895 [Candidatus Thermoplasmatota archaeon]|nr:hypothetical protein [Candidatus Thermoplasmatota archaeon]